MNVSLDNSIHSKWNKIDLSKLNSNHRTNLSINNTNSTNSGTNYQSLNTNINENTIGNGSEVINEKENPAFLQLNNAILQNVPVLFISSKGNVQKLISNLDESQVLIDIENLIHQFPINLSFMISSISTDSEAITNSEYTKSIHNATKSNIEIYERSIQNNSEKNKKEILPNITDSNSSFSLFSKTVQSIFHLFSGKQDYIFQLSIKEFSNDSDACLLQSEWDVTPAFILSFEMFCQWIHLYEMIEGVHKKKRLNWEENITIHESDYQINTKLNALLYTFFIYKRSVQSNSLELLNQLHLLQIQEGTDKYQNLDFIKRIFDQSFEIQRAFEYSSMPRVFFNGSYLVNKNFFKNQTLDNYIVLFMIEKLKSWSEDQIKSQKEISLSFLLDKWNNISRTILLILPALKCFIDWNKLLLKDEDERFIYFPILYNNDTKKSNAGRFSISLGAKDQGLSSKRIVKIKNIKSILSQNNIDTLDSNLYSNIIYLDHDLISEGNSLFQVELDFNPKVSLIPDDSGITMVNGSKIDSITTLSDGMIISFGDQTSHVYTYLERPKSHEELNEIYSKYLFKIQYISHSPKNLNTQRESNSINGITNHKFTINEPSISPLKTEILNYEENDNLSSQKNIFNMNSNQDKKLIIPEDLVNKANLLQDKFIFNSIQVQTEDSGYKIIFCGVNKFETNDKVYWGIGKMKDFVRGLQEKLRDISNDTKIKYQELSVQQEMSQSNSISSNDNNLITNLKIEDKSSSTPFSDEIERNALLLQKLEADKRSLELSIRLKEMTTLLLRAKERFSQKKVKSSSKKEIDYLSKLVDETSKINQNLEHEIKLKESFVYFVDNSNTDESKYIDYNVTPIIKKYKENLNDDIISTKLNNKREKTQNLVKNQLIKEEETNQLKVQSTRIENQNFIEESPNIHNIQNIQNKVNIDKFNSPPKIETKINKTNPKDKWSKILSIKSSQLNDKVHISSEVRDEKYLDSPLLLEVAQLITMKAKKVNASPTVTKLEESPKSPIIENNIDKETNSNELKSSSRRSNHSDELSYVSSEKSFNSVPSTGKLKSNSNHYASKSNGAKNSVTAISPIVKYTHQNETQVQQMFANTNNFVKYLNARADAVSSKGLRRNHIFKQVPLKYSNSDISNSIFEVFDDPTNTFTTKLKNSLNQNQNCKIS